MNGFDLAINLNLGVINDAQINNIQSKLTGGSFNNQISSPGLIVYLDASCGDQIIINPMQFVFRVQRPVEWEDMKKNLHTALEVLQIFKNVSADVQATIRLVDSSKHDGMDIMEESKKHTDFDLSGETLENICGLGYRFFMKHDNSFNEFKVEPLIKNPEIMFF